jgi:hypothetical protein
MEKHFVVIMKTGSSYFLLMNETNEGKVSIPSFPSIREGLDHFEKGYKECLSRDTTWRASAALHWMTFQASIIESKGLDWLKSLGRDPEPRLSRFHSVAGSFNGVSLDPAKAQLLWEEGTKPNLT